MPKFYSGTLLNQRESIEKSVSKIKRSYAEDELEQLGLTVEQARQTMHCFAVDGVRYYQLIA